MKNKKKRILSNFIVIILIIIQSFSCNIAYAANKSLDKDVQLNSLENIRLEDDFYNFINSEWIKNTELKEGCVCYGTFDELSNRVYTDIYRSIVEINKYKDDYSSDSEEIKLLNLYKNFMNLEQRNKNGKKPIEKYINKIDSIKNIDEFIDVMSECEYSYFQPLINLYVSPDCKNTSLNVLYIGSSSLGLKNSLYYKEKNSKQETVENSYKEYIKKLHLLYGESKKDSIRYADNFYNLECQVANDIPTLQEEAKNDDRIRKSYNIYSSKELMELGPNLRFDLLFDKMKIKDPNKIIVESPENIETINKLFDEENLDNLKNFIKTNILISTDNLLNNKFRKASTSLRKVLYGIGSVDINEGSAISFVNSHLRETVSRIYVEKCFDKQSKSEVEELVSEIISKFAERLRRNSWMSSITKEKAIEKLNNVKVKVAYPNKWSDYGGLELRKYEDGGSLVENIINIYVKQVNKQFSKLNHEVDKDEWAMGSFNVNAYYNPLNNEIVFPAAILQAPFFSRDASKEKNLGGIGVVIGHELTHAFDNVGSQFDESGQLNKWWLEEDYKEFNNRSKKIIDYYSNISTGDGNFVNGNLTVGENISDLGGMACVLDIAKQNKRCNLKDLFENYATVWREISTKEIKEYLIKNDPHSPKKIRVNAVLQQFEEFYITYGISTGDKMYIDPKDRLEMW